MSDHREARLTAVALFEAQLRAADPAEVLALLSQQWAADDFGVLISTLLSLFGQLAEDCPRRASELLAANRWAFLQEPDGRREPTQSTDFTS